MNILMLGDVTDPRSVTHLRARLWDVRQQRKIDLVTVNAENAGFLSGAGPDLAETLFEAGADVLTGGNHTMQTLSAHAYMESHPCMLRPLNYPPEVPGAGYVIVPAAGYRILVCSVLGVVDMVPVLDNPFTAVDRLLKREAGKYDFSLLDFHAEATGEKMAMGRYLDGRVNIVAGTHTHVPTADARILPRGTGYVTDLGMCGPTNGVLGMKTEVVIARNVSRLPARFEPADGDITADGVLFSLDTASGKVKAVERISF